MTAHDERMTAHVERMTGHVESVVAAGDVVVAVVVFTAFRIPIVPFLLYGALILTLGPKFYNFSV